MSITRNQAKARSEHAAATTAVIELADDVDGHRGNVVGRLGSETRPVYGMLPRLAAVPEHRPAHAAGAGWPHRDLPGAAIAAPESTNEIMRCLKRFLARELYPCSSPTSTTLNDAR
jgi:hypothetical protein